MIEIEFDNVLADHLHADRLYYSKSLYATLDKAVAVVLLAVGVGLVTIVGWHWWCFVPFPLAIGEAFDLFSIRGIQIRAHFRNNPKFRDRYHLSFTEEGIHFKTLNIDTTLAWAHYSRMLESDRVFLLIYGKRMYTVIPKSAFKSAEDRDRFKQLVTSKLPA